MFFVQVGSPHPFSFSQAVLAMYVSGGVEEEEGGRGRAVRKSLEGRQTSSVLCLVDCARRCEVVLLATPDGHREIVLAVFLVAGDGTDGIGERKLPCAGAAPGSLVWAPASWRAILRPMRLARRDDGAGTRQPCFVGGFEGRGGPAGSNRRTKTPREEEVGMEGRSLPARGWSRSWLARWGTQQSKIGFVQT